MGAELHETAKALVAEGKGILAADESDRTIKKRFDSIDVESTEENRRAYRELLFTADGVEEYISGVILFDETIRQSAGDGTPFPKLLEDRGIIPGIKVDKGTKPLALAQDETITEGLDGLRDRLEEYRELGARFTKWRATYSIGSGRKASGRVLQAVYTELHDQRLDLYGTLLKPNMVLSGYDASDRAGVDEVAEATLDLLHRHVPAAVPGIVFLSGGQTDEDATVHLNAMNARGPHPWQLSFSYGRALQAPALKAWAGSADNAEAAQQAFYVRAKLNGLARSGSYSPEMEEKVAA